LTVEQQMPIPLASVIVLAQKVGEMRLTSAQVTAQREMPADGENFIVGQGPGLAAGERLSIALSGLPHAARWPRYVALGLAIAILAGGWWIGRRGFVEDRAPGLERLEKRRAQLFAELTSLEESHRVGRVTPQAYAERRTQLVSTLERVFAEIDRQAA
jgi:hypothetical protein